MPENVPKPPPSSFRTMLLLLLLLLLTYSIYTSSIHSYLNISYGQLTEEIAKDNLESINISDYGQITGRLKTNATGTNLNFESYIVPGLIEKLNEALQEKNAKPGPCFILLGFNFLPLWAYFNSSINPGTI